MVGGAFRRFTHVIPRPLRCRLDKWLLVLGMYVARGLAQVKVKSPGQAGRGRADQVVAGCKFSLRST